MTAQPPISMSSNNFTHLIQKHRNNVQKIKKNKIKWNEKSTCWSFEILPTFLKSTLLSWIPINSWTIAWRNHSQWMGCIKFNVSRCTKILEKDIKCQKRKEKKKKKGFVLHLYQSKQWQVNSHILEYLICPLIQQWGNRVIPSIYN